MHFIVDADSIAYRAAAAAEKRIYSILTPDGISQEFQYKKEVNEWLQLQGYETAEITFRKEPEHVGNALHNVNLIINGIRNHPLHTTSEYHISSDSSFRKFVAVSHPYKGNRTADKPVHLSVCKDYLLARYNAKLAEWMEADDTVSMAALSTPNSVIVSIDKDLDMVEGKHLNWVKGEVYDITPTEGFRNFCVQMLMGDRTDNIVGIHGIGAVTAHKLLDGLDEPSMFKVVEREYIKQYGECHRSRLLENGRLLWMMRHPLDVWNIPYE